MHESDVRRHNQKAWDKQVDRCDRWTTPVDRETIQRARCGDFAIVLTPIKPVPADWFPPLTGLKTLCLASSGGQQAPVLAAAGAEVTVFDNSPSQLGQDRLVADRDGLDITCVEGDMVDLSMFSDQSFDLIFHPCSNSFVPKVLPVWRECHRVLRSGGVLLAGFTNPMRFLFDDERKENGNLEVRYPLPYSDLDHLDEVHIQEAIDAEKPLEFGHTLEDQIGGQLRAGLMLTGFYEDRFPKTDNDPLSDFLDTFIATRAVKR
ncbi:Ubiquinone biosynthesis O-methyltransferase [Rosistilla carotiformis]|uniref:Ubiquinone biosynthesis O-methyltransferase n=1 Tax=Rosistilla carotiformis TaxID=2528017 RepID=A0A518JYA1_9BACT|nr:class I SAM-dependent methyltransferase [Rosistilla carotiformis]QDV70514.1 Ubiquinone biosynthesis O-methyltransferase [Rosistilla carotiformis]